MMGNELYVFSHIPKTAGFYFKHNIELSRYPGYLMRTSFSYQGDFFNLRTMKKDHFRGKEHFLEYVHSLNQTQKDKTHCLAGHDSYYGIHELFNRPAKYSTFIREPVGRTVSLYNYERNAWDFYCNEMKNPSFMQIEFKRRVNECFAIDGKPPEFEIWLDKVYKKHHIFYFTMTDYLQYLNFIDEKRDQGSLQDALKKFDFVGITETFDEDAAYLYHPFHVRSSMGERNISKKFVSKNDLSSTLIQKIQDLNQDDIVLYECALKQNADYKKDSKDFYIKVAETKRRQKLYYPIDWLKRTTKDILRPIIRPVLVQLGLRQPSCQVN